MKDFKIESVSEKGKAFSDKCECGMWRMGCNCEDQKKIKELKELLVLASEKLSLYRAAHSGEYVGGVEYQGLQNSIEKALKR